MSVREPRWDEDFAIGYQGELCNRNVIQQIRNGAAIEVKTDLRAAETGRLYVEYECLGQPSGIQTTESVLWAFVLGDGAVLYFDVDALRQLARHAWRKGLRVTCARGSHPTKGVAVPLAEIGRWLRDGSEA